ncbi:hypothetical protein CTI12_AA041850 [Artemisia annua]|uniref:Uncharacterized protein n=1 Tax=Artemisia annua TaxID=35608 RepID=A0A2U1QDT7_ARTAN|nr:hypothetical protein CTI12_AA041850 [Artemisia annua]
MVCYILFSQQAEVDFSVILESMKVITNWLQMNMRKIDDSLRRYVVSQDCKVGRHVLVSSTAQVEETGDEEAPDGLQVEQVLEKQTSGGNTLEAQNKKGQGKNKGKKSKKGKR